ncbi:MAG: mandelate racemase/muconate lactonizing enzyme family protein [Bacteroidia bacterium]
MKITKITSEVFEWARPGHWNGSHFYGNASLHKITLYTDEGISGIGWNGGTAATRPQRIFPWFADFYRPLLIGKDPCDTRALVRDLWSKQIKILGPSGLHTQVLAAIIIACWDIKGKAENKSVHQLLGGAKPRIPAYIAGGYYAEKKDLEELRDEMLYNVEIMNARVVKMKVGDPRAGIAGDLARIETVRKAVGPEIGLMVDANCAFDLRDAMEFAKQIADYDIYWFEEPLPVPDFEGYQKLREQSPVRIATGENYYTYADFRMLLEKGGADVLNVDAAICPGYDIALDVAQLAASHNLTIAPHGAQELQLPLVAGVPNGEILEYYPIEVDPLRATIFYPQIKLDADGYVTVPDRPGIGFDLNMEALNRYRVSEIKF